MNHHYTFDILSRQLPHSILRFLSRTCWYHQIHCQGCTLLNGGMSLCSRPGCTVGPFLTVPSFKQQHSKDHQDQARHAHPGDIPHCVLLGVCGWRLWAKRSGCSGQTGVTPGSCVCSRTPAFRRLLLALCAQSLNSGFLLTHRTWYLNCFLRAPGYQLLLGSKNR